jgi:DNA-binding GntR family transcriptional regulator
VRPAPLMRAATPDGPGRAASGGTSAAAPAGTGTANTTGTGTAAPGGPGTAAPGGPGTAAPGGPGTAAPGKPGTAALGGTGTAGSAAQGYVSKTDLVAALIRELIITGELAAGEQLRQRDLAERFRVSQTPVREAMRRLESEGLVKGDTHRGFTVVEPDGGPVEENFQIRAALESLGASLAARKIDAEGIGRLQVLNDRMRALADDDARYADLNRAFHFTIYEYAGSPLLLTLMRLLWASLQGGPRVSRTHAESARQHDAILAALKAGDAAEASAQTHQHIMSAL